MRFSLVAVAAILGVAAASGEFEIHKRQRPSVQTPTMSNGGAVTPYDAATAGQNAGAKRAINKRQRPNVQTPTMSNGGQVVAYDAAAAGAAAKARRAARK